MKTTLPAEMVERISARLSPALSSALNNDERRQPVHTVYGGAHLFKAETTTKLGSIARRSFEVYAADQRVFASVFGLRHDLAANVYARIKTKLETQPVEDLRIDFEDGYGIRTDKDEDAHAVSAAMETAKSMKNSSLPPFFGIRIKSFSEETIDRAIRTLDIYLTSLCDQTSRRLPENFVVTLPKIVSPEQVAALAEILSSVEKRLEIASGEIKLEIMIETALSIIGTDGRSALPALVAAADGRCTGAHFGAFDYTADCGITAQYQDLRHPACDFARNMMLVSLANSGVHLSDGVTTTMPIGPHRGDDLSAEQLAENTAAVHSAWRLHYDNCRWALQNGFYQGWDLHPAQFPARYAAVYAFFLEGLDTASERLKNFVDKAARATMTGNNFDDAATGQGLLNYFIRAMNCGALTEEEAMDRSGLSIEDLRSGSFAQIIKK
ncbi:MAG: aldolase/citrate lyase family protein [Pyrinomonadaceae bacterium]